MNRFTLLLVVLLAIIVINGKGQTRDQQPRGMSTDMEKLQLLSELQSLNTQSDRLNSPLARARAKAEIASALWHLDQEEAKRILTNAYKLTLPEEAEQEKSRARAIGADMGFPSETERARTDVRTRILQVAGQDQAYANLLVKLGSESLGRHEAHLSNALLARQALVSGDTKVAGQYIVDAIEVEPTLTLAGPLIQEIAKKDRAAADALIVKYIERLRGIPFSFSQSTQRIFFVLLDLVFPGTLGMNRQVQVQPPGPAVMKAYASYVVQSFGQLIQRDPGSLVRLRYVILTAGLPVKQYAPELMPAYMELERLSRGGGEGNPIQTLEEIKGSLQRNRQQQLDTALDKETIDASLIEPAVRRGMFDKARKAAENLPEGDRKTQLIDLINAQEAVSFRAKGNIAGAERLAEQLRTPPRIFEVYAALINNCGEDKLCKLPLLNKALKQIKAAESVPVIAPENTPAGLITTQRELDTKLSFLSKLAVIAATVDDTFTRAALADVVSAINHTTVDAELGRLGFDVELFRLCAQKDEVYAQSLALGVTNSLRQIAALSAIDEWKAKELKKKEAEQQLLKKKVSYLGLPQGSAPRL